MSVEPLRLHFPIAPVSVYREPSNHANGNQRDRQGQREIIAGLETALDARQQRIFVSQSQVNLVKWSALFLGRWLRRNVPQL
jgi:hypothetical protein